MAGWIFHDPVAELPGLTRRPNGRIGVNPVMRNFVAVPGATATRRRDS
jgi:hypothetical protein